MRPEKKTLFRPRRPLNERVPWVTARVHTEPCRLCLVWGVQRPLTRRPASSWAKLKLTLAGRSSVQANVVPTGWMRRSVTVAARLPARQRE